ncbi:unnamed protein product [Moneuplotes crassus]|uniref:phosphoinositide 5-phosphatase n=1 Tax=Euplotes crassus TaxID=5936 RepID=A0AAD1UI85_EUPCR|nr:unnamed protein product [Moneuplotes crassus]
MEDIDVAYPEYEWIVELGRLTKISPANGQTPKKALFIENKTLLIQEVDMSPSPIEPEGGYKIKGILGIIQIFPISYLLVIKEHKLVHEITIPIRMRIYEITEVDLLILDKEGEENVEYKDAIIKIMKFGFYYSPDVDLTHRIHGDFNHSDREERKTELIKDIPKENLENLDNQDKFWWNKRLYQNFELCGIAESPWRIRMIRGHVGCEEMLLGISTQMNITLISRKATLMGGIIDTGIDDDGSVSHYVETEQCIEIGSNFISFVMVRGAVPCFYDTELIREFEMHDPAFKYHVKSMIEDYEKVICINLLDINNPYEFSLTKFYEFLVKENLDAFKDCLRYKLINYKEEVLKDDIEKNKQLTASAEAMKFLWITSEGSVKKTQKCAPRFNCLHNLHRSNECQQKISLIVLKKIIRALHDEYVVDETQVKWKLLFPKIEAMYKANQAKICIESGCHCIASKKQEDDGYFQAMYSQITSIEKYFYNFVTSIQAREDNLYQEALEYIRGLNMNQEGVADNSIDKKLFEEEQKYSRINRYKFGFLTWNLAGKNYDKKMDFYRTLHSNKETLHEPADIIFVGFQETRKLNAFAILKGASKTRSDRLKQEVLVALNKIARKHDSDFDYLCFAEESMCGQLILGYCKSSIKWKISKIAMTKIKQGFGGKTGNKGAVVIRFNLDNTSMIVANAHLESGKKHLAERLFQFKDIKENCIVGKGKKSYKFESHKCKFFIGDLNFRINLDYEEAKSLAQNFMPDDKKILEEKDQLNIAKATEEYLQDIREGPLNFRPTYKYDDNSDVYDTSKKLRAPAWCDRILWFKNEKHIDQLSYERKENQFSDHRPVLSFMSVLTYTHDSKLMRELKQEMVRERKEEYFRSRRDSYFSYAVTGKFEEDNKRDFEEDEIEESQETENQESENTV